MSDVESYPGQCDEGHPECFNLKAMPPQPETLKPGQLPREEIEKFFTKGYIVVTDFFKDEELDPCLKAIENIVDRVSKKLLAAGKIKDLHEDVDVFTRLVKIEEQFSGATVLVHKDGILPDEFRTLHCNERLMNLMEQILGPRVCASPIWNIRPKAPGNSEGSIPWHQDNGYFDPAAYTTLLPVTWIPLMDVTPNLGCLQIVEEGHKTGKVCDHLNCYGDTWHVMLDESKVQGTLDVNLEKDAKTLPIKKGSFLLFNNLVPHRSLPNTGDKIRWSLDLRYQRPGEPEGLYGVLPPVLLRDADNPDLIPDWSPFDENRHSNQVQMVTGSIPSEEELDTTITGPWMTNWKIVHHNRHTAALGLNKAR